MASNLIYVMKREDAIKEFVDTWLPHIIIKYEWNGFDEVARCEGWNNYTDHLCKNGLISDWQYENWNHPDICLED
tara:strand:- start:296 stop:520 length:225 start_codon:yes stop_codon:yes gene_type:complete